MDVKVSVIVPVYNGEAHLKECIDSIVNQTLREIEIILVDDGSTDSSSAIMNEYASKDSRVILMSQENKFAGTARNLGMTRAQGEYYVFWDCDDIFEANALEVLYNRAKETSADICVCGVNLYDNNTGVISPNGGYLKMQMIPEGVETFSRQTNEDKILNFTTAVVWNKMYRRAFVEKEQLRFQEIRNGNDVFFSICAMCLADRIAITKDKLINYRVNQATSLVGRVNKSPLAPVKAWMDTAEYLKTKNAFPARSFANKAIDSAIYMLRNISDKEAFYEAVNFYKNGAMDALGMCVQDEEYYYSPWHNDVIAHMRSDEPIDFMMYLAHLNYMHLREVSEVKRNLDKDKKDLKNEVKSLNKKISDRDKKIDELNGKNDRLKAEIEDIKNSVAFKIGLAVMWLPKKVRDIIKPKK